MIRCCTNADIPSIDCIINEAAMAYYNVIPCDCWHEPYMSRRELLAEIAAGVRFWGWEDWGSLIAVMGIQEVRDATLIRHAYVRPSHQHRGIGGVLLKNLISYASGKLLVGTWADADWAIRFYQRHGFQLVLRHEKDRLLSTYWNISQRQQETSVVLAFSRMTQAQMRQAGASDATALTELAMRSKAYWGYDGSFLSDVRRELEFRPEKFQPDFHVYLLENGDGIIGFYSLIAKGDEVELHDLFVDPSHIGTGCGKQLWNHAINLVRKLGFHTLTLIADPNAEPFYSRQGALRVGETTSSIQSGRKLPVMKYRLSE